MGRGITCQFTISKVEKNNKLTYKFMEETKRSTANNLSPIDSEVQKLSEKIEILYKKLNRVLTAETPQDYMTDEPSNLLNDLIKLNGKLEDILNRLQV